nr:MAG TPA: hypothetical protein [Caudoviricetes sp.]
MKTENNIYRSLFYLMNFVIILSASLVISQLSCFC